MMQSLLVLCVVSNSVCFAICDLTVLLRDYNGRKTNARVSIQKDDLLLFTDISKDGIARFCDIGMKEISVIVGDDHCGQVIIRRLPVGEGIPLELPVVFSNCHGFTVQTSCSYLIRFVGQTGSPLPNLHIQAGSQRFETDTYGRIWLMIGPGRSVTLIPPDRWRLRESGHIKCNRAGEDAERTVVATKTDP